MQELIMWDTRLEGKPPLGEEVARVNETVSLDTAIAWAGWKSKHYGGDVSLKILAHGKDTRTGFLAGSEAWDAASKPTRDKDDKVLSPPSARGLLGVYSQGGGGIQFCREWITLGTIHKFGALRGKLKLIEILGCGAAYITPGFEGRDGDGNLLCYRLAQIAGTYVRASTATQYYDSSPAIDFGKWEGTVLTYSPTGEIARVDSYPAGSACATK
jgi:hypothetical protein